MSTCLLLRRLRRRGPAASDVSDVWFDGDDDDRFYTIALSSAVQQIHRAFVACDSK